MTKWKCPGCGEVSTEAQVGSNPVCWKSACGMALEKVEEKMEDPYRIRCHKCGGSLTSTNLHTWTHITMGEACKNAILEQPGQAASLSAVDHPKHYGGAEDPYEAIKVIEAWGLGFCLGNTVKYISRAGKKDPAKELEDLKKAKWYLEREIKAREKK